jgi:hypothetical protein
MKRLALLLTLLAFGGLGLVACGGGDDDETAAASEAETTRGEPPVDSKSCGKSERYRITVVKGASCHTARQVMHLRNHAKPLPGTWLCDGDARVVCNRGLGKGRFRAHRLYLER